MTNKEAIQSSLPVDASDLIDKLLIDQSITGSDTYTASNKDSIEIATAYCLKALAFTNNFKEGGLAISFNTGELIKQANLIFKKHNLTTEVVEEKAQIKFDQLP